MKVIHIVTGLDGGGAEAVLHRLCLATKQQTVAVISLGPPSDYSRPLEHAGVPVHHLDLPRGRLTWRGLVTLYRLIRRLQPDVVQTWMYHGDLVGGVVSRLAGCRNIVWNVRHSELEPGSASRSTMLVVRLCAVLSWIVPRYIVVCAKRAAAVHGSLGYQSSKFTLIANGYDSERLRPDSDAGRSLREELKLTAHQFVVGCVGRWHPQKDHRTLLDAVSRLSMVGDVVVVLAGHGCDRGNPTLASLVKEFGLTERVRLLGRRDDIAALMNTLDVHILSSSHGEAFPNVVAEAMACGTPCIVTDVGDAAEIVGATGWVVPPRAPEALATALRSAWVEWAEGCAWASRRRANRVRIVNSFPLDKMVAQYRDVWAASSNQRR